MMRRLRLAVNLGASLLTAGALSLPVTELADLVDDSWSEDGATDWLHARPRDRSRPAPTVERHGRVFLADDSALPAASGLTVSAALPCLTDFRDSSVRLPRAPRQKPRSVRVVGEDLERGPPPSV